MENAARLDLPENSKNYLMLEAGKLNGEIASLLSEIRLRINCIIDMTKLIN